MCHSVTGLALVGMLFSNSQTKHSFARKDLQNNNNQLENVPNQFASLVVFLFLRIIHDPITTGCFEQ